MFIGFPRTRGDLLAMSAAELWELAAYYHPGYHCERKEAVLERLCLLFGIVQ